MTSLKAHYLTKILSWRKYNFEELGNVSADISSKTHHSHSQVRDSQLVVALLKNRVSTLEKQLIEKNDSTTRKDHPEPSNTNSITEMQQSSEQHRFWEMKIQTSHQEKEFKKVVVTRYSMLNFLSEKWLIKSHIITIGNFPCGTSDTTVENLDQ